MKEFFEKMLAEHVEHLNRLKRWRKMGGMLQNYPEGETLADFITREEAAIEKIKQAIQILKV